MFSFDPEYKAVPWGGRRLTEEFGRSLPDGPIGESWELVELDGHHSAVADGPRAGEKLGDLWRAGLLGGSGDGPFPFLLKWIDSDDLLSVQVHPDQAACEQLGTGRPKSEAWCVAHAQPRAKLYLGHYPGLDPATLRQASEGGTIHKWMYESQPRVGDMLYVPAGTLHAIGAGFLLLEVQQPSDTTFRVYDWGRADAGRELHIDQAAVAVAYNRHGPHALQRQEIRGPTFLLKRLTAGSALPADQLRVIVAHTGPTTIKTERGDARLEVGDVVVAEKEDGEIRLAGGDCLWVSEP